MNLLQYIGNAVSRASESRFFSQAKTLGIRRIIGYSLGVNLNSAATDTPVTLYLMPGTNFVVRGFQVNNASVSLTTATASLYTATGGSGGSGIALVNDAALSALTTATSNLDMTINTQSTVLNQATLATPNTLYIRCGTAQGAAATGDFYIWGECLP